MLELEIRTADRDQFVDVTAQVADAVRRLGLVSGPSWSSIRTPPPV